MAKKAATAIKSSSTTGRKIRTMIPPNKPRTSAAPDASAVSRAVSAARIEISPARKRARPVIDPRPRPIDKRLAAWETDVRVMLAVTEFASQFRVTPSANGTKLVASFGSVNSREIFAPTVASLYVREDGLPGVLREAKKQKQRDLLLDEIQVHAFDLESLFHIACVIDPIRRPVTAEVSKVLMEIATIVVQRIKDILDVPRPSELDPEVRPVIPVPGHASFPSGHAVQATVMACMLSRLCKNHDPTESALRKLARRVAHLRVVAGVHYPIDSAAGVELGLLLAKTLAASVPCVDDAPMQLPVLAALWATALDERDK